MKLQAPFPYFGGKSRAADLVWSRLGNPPNYVEPFAGSLAVLLSRPSDPGTETVNDLDGFVCNAWRAIAYAPEAVAHYADWPVNENDLHARHIWLVRRRETLSRKLEADPYYFDAKTAGFWIWGMCSHIGGGWCSGIGPWQAVYDDDGNQHLITAKDNSDGITRSMPHLGSPGQGITRSLINLGPNKGVNRQTIHKGDSDNIGIIRPRPSLLGNKGIHRSRIHLSGDQGVHRKNILGADVITSSENLLEWFNALASRLRRVRVTCGQWDRILGPSVTIKNGITGVLLDPPYAGDVRCEDLYATDSHDVSKDVREWAIANGDEPLLRIALCGYDGEHEMPDSWECVKWHAQGGYGSQNPDNHNKERERVWFSPHCLKAALPLFGE